MTNIKKHKKYLYRCLHLAENGIYTAAPNPMVGSVIVFNGKIIGEGWHRKPGEPHAEILAINSVKDKFLLNESILYVNLEPCSHYGRTPPCTKTIIDAGIPKVIFCTLDNNLNHESKGVSILKENGIEVQYNILSQMAYALNKRYFKSQSKKIPYIILKWAESKDGYIDKLRLPYEKGINWLSNIYSRQIVHEWRSMEQAIMVGTYTLKVDNPKLNCRDIFGTSPTRVFLDRNGTIPEFILHSPYSRTLVFTEISKCNKKSKNIEFIQYSFDDSLLTNIMNELWKREIISIIIEGGKITLNHFINQNLWDEARIFTSNKILKNGIKAPSIQCYSSKKTTNIGTDILNYIYNSNHYICS